MAQKIAILQAGGPTAVLNCSLYGLLKEIYRCNENAEIFGVRNGMAGLATGDWYPIDRLQPLEWLRFVPGAALGSGRKPLSDDDFETAILKLKQADIHTVALLGGNGTMWSCSRLSRMAEEIGYDLQVVGIPKTVDNDLTGMDHTPGFPSAAKFVAYAVRDLSTDLAAMKNFEQVRVIETMGRNVGWLAASAVYFKERPEDAPHLTYVPEVSFHLEDMLKKVADIQSQLGYCVIVVSEGLKGKDGRPIMMKGITAGGSAQPKALGGVGSVLADAINANLGLSCRYENLGILQRCASFHVSELDRIEAEALGTRGAQMIFRGEHGLMVGIQRVSDVPYQWEIREMSFDGIGGRERELEQRYISSAGRIDPSYRTWLEPFMGPTISYRTTLSQRR